MAALTRIITIGVQEGRRRHDPTINEDMVTLLDSIISEREWLSSANGTTINDEGRLDIAGETFTVPVAAARLGCSPRTLRKAIGERRLRATKVGRDWLITLPDLNSYRFRKGRHHGAHHT